MSRPFSTGSHDLCLEKSENKLNEVEVYLSSALKQFFVFGMCQSPKVQKSGNYGSVIRSTEEAARKDNATQVYSLLPLHIICHQTSAKASVRLAFNVPPPCLGHCSSSSNKPKEQQ
jgi:hypothetical protein